LDSPLESRSRSGRTPQLALGILVSDQEYCGFVHEHNRPEIVAAIQIGGVLQSRFAVASAPYVKGRAGADELFLLGLNAEEVDPGVEHDTIVLFGEGHVGVVLRLRRLREPMALLVFEGASGAHEQFRVEVQDLRVSPGIPAGIAAGGPQRQHVAQILGGLGKTRLSGELAGLSRDEVILEPAPARKQRAAGVDVPILKGLAGLGEPHEVALEAQGLISAGERHAISQRTNLNEGSGVRVFVGTDIQLPPHKSGIANVLAWPADDIHGTDRRGRVHPARQHRKMPDGPWCRRGLIAGGGCNDERRQYRLENHGSSPLSALRFP